MKKVLLIIKREYVTRVRKRSFIVTTLLAPIGFSLLFLAIIFLSDYGHSKKRIAVLDESGYFQNKFADAKDQTLYLKFVDTTLAYLDQHYKAMGYDGILFIPRIKDLSNPRGIEYRSDKQLSIKSKAYIKEEIERVIKNEKIAEANIDKDFLDDLDKIDAGFDEVIFGEEGVKQGSSVIATALGYIMGLLVYMVMFIYGTMVMRGVMEEKTNRVVEVITSSVRPFQLMLGKIIGIGAVGITQFLLWAILIFIANISLTLVFSGSIAELSHMANNPEMGPSVDQQQVAQVLAGLSDIPVFLYLFYFLFYFFGGYLLYGALFAAIGSATNDDGDVQSLTFFISVPIITSVVIMMSVIQEPDSSLAIWSSIIPFTSPIVMPARIPFDPEAWQIITSMLALIAGFLFTTWLAAKIYRTGILLYGKKVTVKEIARWIFYSK